MPSYCERSGSWVLAEPFNMLSSLAFLAAALAGWRLARHRGGSGLGVGALICLALAMGVGSALLHLVARPWAWVADVVPIAAFQLVFLGLYLRAECSAARTFAFLVLFSVACLVAGWFPAVLNGSLFYLPSVFGLAALGVRDWRRSGQRELFVASGLLFAGLISRTLDPWVCGIFRHGSHFL